MMTQYLADIIQLNTERVMEYNRCAYATSDIHLKALLNRETDNGRENILKLNVLIHDNRVSQFEYIDASQLFSIWNDLRPYFRCDNVDNQLKAFELADLVAIRLYSKLLSQNCLDSWVRTLLEFQLNNGVTIYKAIKSFREAYSNNKFNSHEKQFLYS